MSGLVIDDAIQVMKNGIWKLVMDLNIHDTLLINAKTRTLGIGGFNDSDELLKINSGIVIGDALGTEEGTIRYNSTTKSFEGRNDTAWQPMSDVAVRELPIAAKVADYPMVPADYTILADGTSVTVDVTLPDPTAVSGYVYVVKAINIANAVRVLPNSGTIDGAANYTFAAQYDSIMVQSDGTNWHILAAE